MFFFKFIKIIYKFLFINRTKNIIEKYNLDKSKAYVWGMKSTGKNLRKKFINTNKLIYLEDGFINSIGIKKSILPLSICIDKNGIYYDFQSNSILFKTLSTRRYNRKRALLSFWVSVNEGGSQWAL